jgi:ribosomal protein S18 acetylase RimI-like enzyme
MERALNQLWQWGVKPVELSVRVKNRQALKVYERFGFQAVPDRTIIVLQNDLK